MTEFFHPSKDDITLTGVFGALSDPIRLKLFLGMLDKKSCMSCTEASPCPKIAKSTLSNHFRVLRESGLIKTTKQGVEHRNAVRKEELESRFPGLLKTIAKLA